MKFSVYSVSGSTDSIDQVPASHLAKMGPDVPKESHSPEATVHLSFAASWEDLDLSPFGEAVANMLRDCPEEVVITAGTPLLFDAKLQPIEPWMSYFFALADSVGPSTLKDYGYDAKKIESFLRGRGKSVISASRKDFPAFKRHRLEECSRPASPATYRRELVTVHGIYDHCVATGLLKRRPWIQVGRKSPLKGPKPVQDLKVRCLSRDQWLAFRNVGLAGQLPDGRSDPDFRGGSPTRNSAAADLGIGSGMRISEFTSVLDVEIPRYRPHETATLEIQATAKYQNARIVDLSAEARRSIDLYRATERRRVVRRNARKLEKNLSRLFLVDEIDPVQLRLTGTMDRDRQSWAISALPRHLREVAVVEGEFGIEAMSLFLGATGLPPRPRSWSEVFHSASKRMNCFRGSDGLPTMPPRIVAHDLRHTYAVVFLRHLTMIAAEMEAARRKGRLGHGSINDHLIWNPLLRLQERMGHASLQTTMKYLKNVADSSDIVREAMETWLEADRSYADYITEMFRQGASV